jgi:activator of HSP90 ATPase
VGTIGLALISLNNQPRENRQEVFNKFLSFMDQKIGLNVAQLLPALRNNQSLQNLTEGISNYLAERESPGSVTTGPQQSAGAENAAKSKTGSSGGTTLAAAISSLADALSLVGNTSDPNYWKVFSAPASPILPNQGP